MFRDVRPGQVWADNDCRAVGRKVRVEKIDGEYAKCTVVADRDKPHVTVRGRYNHDRQADWSPVGLVTRIPLRRFRPTSTAYRLIEDAPPPEAGPRCRWPIIRSHGRHGGARIWGSIPIPS